MTAHEDLLETIEEIRKQQFSDLPSELVKQIALIERDFSENRQEAYKRIAHAIDEYLNKNPVARKAEE